MESVFNKVAGLQAPIQVFSCEICEIFKNTFFYRTPPVISGKIEILPEKHKIPQTITNEALQRRQGNSWFLYRCKNFRILIFVVYFWKQKINFGNSILISNFLKQFIVSRYLLRENCSYSKFLWPVLSCIQTEYGDTFGIYPYSFWMQENTDQKNSEYWHFSHSDSDC